MHIIYETSDDETIYYMKKKETTDISVANISLYYELGKDDKLKTIDKYSDRFETKEDKSFDSENEVFLAARDPQTNTI